SCVRKLGYAQQQSCCSDGHGGGGYTLARPRARQDGGKLKAETLVWLYRHVDAALLLGRVADFALAQREQCVVLADPDAAAGMPLRTALADNNVSGKHVLTARLLDPEPATDRVAPVAR